MPEPDAKDPQPPPPPAVPFTIGFNLNPEVRGVGLMVPRRVDPATITPPEPTPIGTGPEGEAGGPCPTPTPPG